MPEGERSSWKELDLRERLAVDRALKRGHELPDPALRPLAATRAASWVGELDREAAMAWLDVLVTVLAIGGVIVGALVADASLMVGFALISGYVAVSLLSRPRRRRRLVLAREANGGPARPSPGGLRPTSS